MDLICQNNIWRRLFSGLVVCCLVSSDAFAQAPTTDPSLILHYTFDQDTGQTVQDLSLHSNHGEAVKTQYLNKVKGRQGVLRFNDEESVINCPDSDSLFFEGDMTIEMWVRLNGSFDPSSGILFGDSNPLDISMKRHFGNYAFYMSYWNTLTFFYQIFNAELDAYDRMLVPVERHIISEKWSHIAVVVAYPRIRFFHNGELVRDAFMPFPGVLKRSRPIHKIGDRKAPIDLDEFRLYRRALTAAEVEAHAKAIEVPPPLTQELFVEPHWYEQTLAMRLSCKGGDYRKHIVEMTLLQGNQKQAVVPQQTELSESFEGSGRYVATATFPLKGLEGKSLNGVARISSPEGTEVNTVYRHAFLAKPDWVHTQEGYWDGVPPPWTPVQAQQNPDGTVAVRVWGRHHEFAATAMLNQIEARNKQILAAPIELTARANGQELTWKDGRVELKETSETIAVLEQTLNNESATLRIDTDIEYDGYMLFNCTLRAKKDLNLEQLRLQIPLRSEHASLCYGARVYPKEPGDNWMTSMNTGAVRSDLAFRFSPNIWLGDEQRGLCWQVESDEHWRPADQQKAIEILPRNDVTIFRANLVEVPKELAPGETLHYRFALLATPVKPLLRDAWDLRIVRFEPYGRGLELPEMTTDGVATAQVLLETGIRRILTLGGDMWPYPMPIHERYSRMLTRMVNTVHAEGMRVHPYLIHERLPTMAPEFDIHGLHMLNRPIKTYYPGPYRPPGADRPGAVSMQYGADSQGNATFCTKSIALQDMYIHSLAQRLDVYGEDGVYLDGTSAHTTACKNMLHGCGYRAEDGTIHATSPVFANRDFIRRIYATVKQRRPDGVVDLHSTGCFNSSALAYADVMWTGEHWYHLRMTGTDYIAGELSLDMFRTEFMGYQIGVAADTLTHRLLSGDRNGRHLLATSLLHDIPFRTNTRNAPTGEENHSAIIFELWKLRDRFGAAAPEVEKLFYWENQDYVRVTPQKCYATLLKHPDNGVLALISNLKRNTQTVSVTFNLNKLGFHGQKIDAFDALTNEPVELSPRGNISVSLKSEDWIYIWIRSIAHK